MPFDHPPDERYVEIALRALRYHREHSRLSTLHTLYLRCRGRCQYCLGLTWPSMPQPILGEIGSAVATLDHKIPLSRGGEKSGMANLTLACSHCNGEKADMMADEYWRWKFWVANREGSSNGMGTAGQQRHAAQALGRGAQERAVERV
jgi:5-methylcytosine-specific restriction endonuclease McrA